MKKKNTTGSLALYLQEDLGRKLNPNFHTIESGLTCFVLRQTDFLPGKIVLVMAIATVTTKEVRVERFLEYAEKRHQMCECYTHTVTNADETAQWCSEIMLSTVNRQPTTDELVYVGFRDDVPEGIGF